MSQRRILTIALILAVALPAGLALLTGCESRPDEPVYDNPWDPDGPLLGDPLNVTAVLGDTSITVVWSQPQGFGIVSYEIDHSLTYGSGYTTVKTVAATSQPTNSWSYPAPLPTAAHYFRVRAIDTNGDFSITSTQRPGSVLTPPLVSVGTGKGKIATRYPVLSVTVSAGDSLQVANNVAFDAAQSFPVVAAGTAQEVIWDVGPAAANGAGFKIYVRTVTLAGLHSATSRDSVTLDFTPDFTVVGDPVTVGTRLVDLAVPPAGIVNMRFALDEADLAAQPWTPGAATYAGFLLEDSANPQIIHGEFEGDFGFNVQTQLTVTPEVLEAPAFTLDWIQDGATSHSTLRIRPDAAATWMRFAESADFSGTDWQAYQDTVFLQLSPVEGQKTVFAQFRNEFADSPLLSESFQYVALPVEVWILQPIDGQRLPGGTAYQVVGTSTAASGLAAADSVKFDAGDGAGFRPVDGLDRWTAVWDVPDSSASVPVTLRARAWAGADSATTSVTVVAAPAAR